MKLFISKTFFLALITFTLCTNAYSGDEEDLAYLENDFELSTGITSSGGQESSVALNMGMHKRGIVIKNLSETKVMRILEIVLDIDISSTADLEKLNIQIIPLAIDRKTEGRERMEWNNPNGAKDTLIFFPIEISRDMAMDIEREISIYAYGFQKEANIQINDDAPKAQWIYTNLDARFGGIKNFEISSYNGGENLTGFSMFELKAAIGYGRKITDEISIRFVVGASHSWHWTEKVMNGVENASQGIKDTHAFAKIEVGTDTDILSLEGRYHHLKSFAKDDNLYTNYEDLGINESNFSFWLKYKRKW